MLVPIPIGLWVFSLVADVVVRAGWGGPAWIDVARYTMAGGIVGALLAAVPGLIDYRSFRHPDTRRIGRTHLTLNLVIVAMYGWLFLACRRAIVVAVQSPRPVDVDVSAAQEPFIEPE